MANTLTHEHGRQREQDKLVARAKAAATQMQDRRLLQRVAPAPGSPVAPAASLSIEQRYEIERCAGIRMNLSQIGVWLRIPEPVWMDMIVNNPQVAEAYTAGAVRMQHDIMASNAKAAMEGDVAAQKYWLDRHGGEQWAPPNVRVEQVSAHTLPQTEVIIGRVNSSIDKQRALMQPAPDADYTESK